MFGAMVKHGREHDRLPPPRLRAASRSVLLVLKCEIERDLRAAFLIDRRGGERVERLRRRSSDAACDREAEERRSFHRPPSSIERADPAGLPADGASSGSGQPCAARSSIARSIGMRARPSLDRAVAGKPRFRTRLDGGTIATGRRLEPRRRRSSLRPAASRAALSSPLRLSPRARARQNPPKPRSRQRSRGAHRTGCAGSHRFFQTAPRAHRTGSRPVGTLAPHLAFGRAA